MHTVFIQIEATPQLGYSINFNKNIPPMDDQQGKFSPWTKLMAVIPPWTVVN
jgi:hypothetical protein